MQVSLSALWKWQSTTRDPLAAHPPTTCLTSYSGVPTHVLLPIRQVMRAVKPRKEANEVAWKRLGRGSVAFFDFCWPPLASLGLSEVPTRPGLFQISGQTSCFTLPYVTVCMNLKNGDWEHDSQVVQAISTFACITCRRVVQWAGRT
eukprot:TRINITY_DN20419_c0_g1_i3.p2 TRINITY_DN20419_c0_g1~~TRINITY_DN20419_c0_g1_i3.p2  ORF type:complete len:147 (+),score=14.10 TRINITY_DN20419_c0_g1_i3:564-1004(+)